MSYFEAALEQLELNLAENPWTVEREALLREYYPKMRAWDVANRIGKETSLVLNKNQIIGKANRLGLLAFKSKPIRSPRGADKPSTRVRWHPKPQTAQNAAPMAVPPIQKVIEPPKMNPMGYFDDWPNDRCRWAFGDPKAPDFYFCGAEGADVIERRPYCAFHAKISYAPARTVLRAAGPKG